MTKRRGIVEREALIREEVLIGEEAVFRLRQAKVAVFGIGGVGGFAVEALARCGIGRMNLFDSDRISVSNRNRQIIAMTSTVGELKVDVMKARILDINPEAEVHSYPVFYLPENADQYELSQYDYLVDAIDTVTAKLELAWRAQEEGISIISSMGTGNKLDPTMLQVADIYQTSVCPLAKVMRRECRRRGIRKLKVVYSQEECRKPQTERLLEGESTKRVIPGSVAFVPSAAGLIMAAEVVKDLIGREYCL